MDRCHICAAPIPHHDHECRVHSDLRLFRRVYTRLMSEGRNPGLQANLARQLERHGGPGQEDLAAVG
ncbi:MAG: hypothetical protein ACM33T_06170 [Solirubrobacterales bacterium]